MTQPTPSNDYLIELTTALDPTTLNSILGSISTRLKAQEALVVDYEAAIEQLQNLGLLVIAETLGPQLEEAQTSVTALQALVAELEDQVTDLIGSILPAANISVSAIAGLTATNAQAAIVELLGKITGVASALATLGSTVGNLNYQTLRPGVTTAVSMTAVKGQRIFASGAINITTPLNPVDFDVFSIDPAGLNVNIVANPAGTATTIQGATNVRINQKNVGVDLTCVANVWKISRRSIVNG